MGLGLGFALRMYLGPGRYLPAVFFLTKSIRRIYHNSRLGFFFRHVQMATRVYQYVCFAAGTSTNVWADPTTYRGGDSGYLILAQTSQMFGW